MTPQQKRLAVATAAAVAIAIPAEGLRQWAYQDPPGIWTICYGSTTNVKAGQFATMDECRARLDADMLTAITAVERCAPGLPEPALAAFADAVFNIGPTIVCDTQRSTAARLLKAGQVRQACEQLPRWNKANVGGRMVELPGLTKRRAKELELCLRAFEPPPALGVVG